MSERFLKYETENKDLPVDERGVLEAQSFQADFNNNDPNTHGYIHDKPCHRTVSYNFTFDGNLPYGMTVMTDLSSMDRVNRISMFRRETQLDPTNIGGYTLIYDGFTFSKWMTLQKSLEKPSVYNMIDDVNYYIDLKPNTARIYFILDTDILSAEYTDKFTIPGIYLEDLDTTASDYVRNIIVTRYAYAKLNPKYIPTSILTDTANSVKNGDKSMILTSSTEGSSKKFEITVTDDGTIKATEIV